MLIRSQSLSLQIPVTTDGSGSGTFTPLMSTSSTFSSAPETCPDFQRVTISGDYCAGVGIMDLHGADFHIDYFNKLIKKPKIYGYVHSDPSGRL